MRDARRAADLRPRRAGPVRHLRVSREVAAPASTAWALLAELGRWPAWGPSVRAVQSDAPRVAPGVEGRVETPIGLRVPFRITQVVEGERWSWRVAGVPATGHAVTPLGDDRCRVELSVPIAGFPYTLVLWIALRRIAALAEQEAAGERAAARGRAVGTS